MLVMAGEVGLLLPLKWFCYITHKTVEYQLCQQKGCSQRSTSPHIGVTSVHNLVLITEAVIITILSSLNDPTSSHPVPYLCTYT